MISRSFRVIAAMMIGAALTSAQAADPRADLPEPHAAAPEEGRDLLGTRPPEWGLSDWIGSAPLTLSGLRGQVVLVRWWTAPTCPFCAASADGLNQLSAQYRDQGLVVIGAYHHKSRAPLTSGFVKQQAERLGFKFPVAVDPDWRTLRKWWLSTGDRNWTSVTFLIGRDGTIQHIHGGGAYWPGEPGFAALEQAVKTALDAPIAPVGLKRD